MFLDLLAVTGFVAIVYGSWLAYSPAGPLVGGGLALAFALAARGGGKPENED